MAESWFSNHTFLLRVSASFVGKDVKPQGGLVLASCWRPGANLVSRSPFQQPFGACDAPGISLPPVQDVFVSLGLTFPRPRRGLHPFPRVWLLGVPRLPAPGGFWALPWEELGKLCASR